MDPLLALKIIAGSPNILGKVLDSLSMPNIPLSTMGGEVFWNNLAEFNGWRLQKNMFTGHCRILDPDDVRRAWGGMSAMDRIFERISRFREEDETSKRVTPVGDKFCPKCRKMVVSNFCPDCGTQTV